MKKYIDADALVEHLKDIIQECGNPDSDTKPITYGCVLGLRGALSYAQTLPTAEVVEVVRCKDCKYYETDIWDGEILCGCNNPSGMQDVSADGYCSYGERKGGKE